MQNTRLNSIVNVVGVQVQRQLQNPWRRLATMTISLLFGVFLGIAIAATAGQRAYWDVSAAALVVLFTEALSWLFYSSRWRFRQTLWGESLNALKIGIIYGLFLIAFMLGS